MIKKNLIPIIFFFLVFIVFTPFHECAAAAKRQVVILDLPCLNLMQISEADPNLLKLVSTGSTGLVRIPEKNGTIFSNGRHGGVLIINGDDFLDVRAFNQPLSKNSPPCDYRPGIDTILKNFRLLRERAGIIVISAGGREGETGRQRNSGEERGKSDPKKVLRIYDDLVARVSAEIDFKTTLLLVCTSQPQEKSGITNADLRPVVFKGPGFTTGILYSSSTRKKGMITGNDLRALVLRFQNSKTGAAFPIKNIPGEWRVIAESQPALVKNYFVRWPLLTTYGYLLLGTICLIVTGLVFRWRWRLITPLAWVYLYLLAVPGAFMVEAILNPLNWTTITIDTLGITSALFLVSYFLSQRNTFHILMWVSFLTAGLVAIDGILNGRYESLSFLGYSVVSGARYYGIGNEYMGVLLGSYIVGAALIFPRLGKWRREILWCAAILTGVILIHPKFGADVGGGITAVLGLGTTNYLLLKQPVRIKKIVRLFILTLTVIIFAGIWDLYVEPTSMTHLGQLLLAIRDHGFPAFLAVATRKLEMNYRLISQTPLTLILIGVLLAIPFLYRYPPAKLKALREKYEESMAGVTGLSITALIGMLVNDSGIASAAMVFMFGIGLIMLIVIEEKGVTKTVMSYEF